MKKSTLVKLLCMLVAVFTLATVASAAGFTKTLQYEDGTFTDVKSTSWYSKEVASAYELGFMNGKGEGKFAPDGNVTVAEAITMASRVHAIYNGKEIAKTEGKWYDMYVQYALANGIIAEGQYTNFDRNIMRYEMAVMFADSMPESYFAAKNDVKAIPDVDPEEEYHDKLMMLYKAGVVMGSTEYGDFLATNSIKRSETAAIINRVALPENRLSKSLKEYDRNEAVYLIDNHTMLRTVRSRTMLASGWRYENTIDTTLDSEDKSSNTLVDVSEIGHAAMHRDITTVSEGIAELEAIFYPDSTDFSIILSDIIGRNMFTLSCDADGSFSAIGDTEMSVNYKYERKNLLTYFVFDLDNRKATVVIDGKEIGVFDMSSFATDISRLTFTTHDEGTGSLTVSEVYMYADYVVNDEFRITPIGSAPYGWDVKGRVTVQKQVSDLNAYSARVNGNATALKKFDAVSGKFIYETFVKTPMSQSFVLSLKNGEENAVSISVKDGKISSGDVHVRDYNPNIWQLIRIEGDTQKGTALIKINGKECASVPLTAKSIDTITITSEGKGNAYFDDVELYYTYDYLDYCPTPVPVTDDEWYVGMSVCSLWREGSHYGWDCITPYDEATPVLGYYDEGNPEVADWEIKMLVEHGYDFQHFCWYVGNATDGIKEPRLCDALHNGYFNAKYSGMQDFMIMWENNGYSFKTVSDFKSKVWDYWCDWYFSDDRYFTIDNKPVLTIYQYQKFVDSLEGEESAKEVIEFMREDIKKLGYDGMIILICNHATSKSSNQKFINLGADAAIVYNLGENSYIPEYQINQMNTAYNAGYISLMPSVSVGFNDIGWTETRTPNATPENYKKVLEWARDDYMPRLDERENEAWKSHFVIGNTWNEYGEGHYIMPSNVCGFGYIDANRQVFSAAAGTDDSKHFDVTPTINQKKRLGTLFPNRTQLIKRTYWIEDEKIDPSTLKVVKGWNFENKNDCLYWIKLMNTTDPVYSDNEKCLVGKALTNDAAIQPIQTGDDILNAENIQYMRIKMKLDKNSASNVTLYFMTEDDTNYVQERGVQANTVGTGEFEEIYLDLSANKYWRGKITNLRLDPTSSEDTYYIKSIEFLGKNENDTDFVIDVDGGEYRSSYTFVKKTGDEVFVAGNPTTGFYSLHNFYTEWNRYEGRLLLKTGTNHTFEFTVGSDMALVDGAEKKMADKFDVIDGLPYIPLKFIYKNAGIKYKQTKTGFEVTIRGRDIIEAKKNRVENEFEFNVDTDTEGWKIGCAFGNVTGGKLIMEAKTNSGGNYDPMITNSNVVIDTNLYNSCEVRFRPTFANPSAVNSPITLYFATSEQTSLNEAKSVKVYISELTLDGDGYYTVLFDLSQNEFWRGTAMTIRFDPTNSQGIYEIDYIRMIYDKDAKAKLDEINKQKQELEKNRLEADEGKPFYIVNADAEAQGIIPESHPSYVPIKISEDELIKGNHAFEHVPDGAKKNWAYTMFKTRFKEGVTYKVEFDIRVTKDHTGADVEKASLSWNMRYTDVVNGSYKQNADHHAAIGTFGTADGWQHVSFTHTITDTGVIRNGDYFSVFANPIDMPDGTYRVIGYMIDNIKVSVVE